MCLCVCVTYFSSSSSLDLCRQWRATLRALVALRCAWNELVARRVADSLIATTTTTTAHSHNGSSNGAGLGVPRLTLLLRHSLVLVASLI